jgi:hypothetical protein
MALGVRSGGSVGDATEFFLCSSREGRSFEDTGDVGTVPEKALPQGMAFPVTLSSSELSLTVYRDSFHGS